MATGIIQGLIRGTARTLFGGGSPVSVALSDGAEVVVAQGLPPETELARLGLGFFVIGTAVAPVAAIPTTGAHLSLYNGGTKNSLVIAAVGSFCATSMAVAGQTAILVRNDVPGANTNPAGTLVIAGTNGSNYGGSANAKASVTLAALAANNNVGWVPAGPSAPAGAATTIGVNQHVEVSGRWVVRPGGMFSMATLAQSAVGACQPYIYFYELPLNQA